MPLFLKRGWGDLAPLTKGRIQVGLVFKMLNGSSRYKNKRRNPPGPLYKGEIITSP